MQTGKGGAGLNCFTMQQNFAVQMATATSAHSKGSDKMLKSNCFDFIESGLSQNKFCAMISGPTAVHHSGNSRSIRSMTSTALSLRGLRLFDFEHSKPEIGIQERVTGIIKAGPLGASCATSMVLAKLDPGGNMATQLSTLGINIDSLAHLQWSPRSQSHRAAEALSTVREHLDQIGLTCLIDKQIPTLEAFAAALPQL